MVVWLVLPLLLGFQQQQLVNRERMTELFLQLVQIDSGSENEAEIGRFVADLLKQIGADEVLVDNASEKLGGTGGNVFARFKGTAPAPPVLLSCPP
jgi:tripeptide aminopeptidase